MRWMLLRVGALVAHTRELRERHRRAHRVRFLCANATPCMPEPRPAPQSARWNAPPPRATRSARDVVRRSCIRLHAAKPPAPHAPCRPPPLQSPVSPPCGCLTWHAWAKLFARLVGRTTSLPGLVVRDRCAAREVGTDPHRRRGRSFLVLSEGDATWRKP